MNFKRLFISACCAASCLALCACNTHNGGNGGGNPPYKPGTPSYDPVSGEITDNNDVTVNEPADKTEHSYTVSSQNGGTITFSCSDCDKKETVVISCVSGTQNAFSVEGSTITFSGIATTSEYSISGKLHGNIVIDAADSKFELSMSDFELYSHATCPVSIVSGDKVTLSAKKDTENYIYDLRAEVDENGDDASAAVYAQCDLDVQGKGKLGIRSENNNGIHTKDDLKVKNLSLQVDCVDNALKGNDSVAVESGDVVLIARNGDGIKTTNSDVSKKGNQRGTVAVTGGRLLIYAACDGIDAAYDVTVDESVADVDLQIFTDKYSKFTNSNNDSADNGTRSTKGITADNAINISAGSITVSAYGDALHADKSAVLENGESPRGDVTVSGGALLIRSDDDAVHADGNVSISGGTVNIVGSHEGIEGKNVTISSGEVSIVATEDGINGTAKSGNGITVSGGKLYVLAGGDGVDSNSQTSYEGVRFTGGKSVIISTGAMDSSIDTERGYTFTGGYVVAVCKSGGMSSEATKCANFSSVGTSKTLSLSKDSYLVVDGVAAVKLPTAIDALVVCLGKTNADISTASTAGGNADGNGVVWKA